MVGNVSIERICIPKTTLRQKLDVTSFATILNQTQYFSTVQNSQENHKIKMAFISSERPKAKRSVYREKYLK